jgi:tetratricopeptide (TPR) repeat protein
MSPEQETQAEATSDEPAPLRPVIEPTPDADNQPGDRRGPRREPRFALVILLALALAAVGVYGVWVWWKGETQSAGSTPAGASLRELLHQAPAPEETETPAEDRVPLDPLIPDSAPALLKEAERVASDLTERFPRNPDAWEMAARFHSEFGEMDQALAAWRRCLDLNPDYVYAHLGLAKAAAEQGEFADAAAHYRRAVLVDPKNLAHQIELGKVLLTKGDLDEALVVLGGVVKADPQNAQGHAELGSAQLQKRDDAAARDSFEATLRLNPDYGPAHFGLATAYTRLGDAEQARAHEAKFREFRAERGEEVHAQRAGYNDEEALRVDIARVYTDLARVYVAEGRLAAAEHLWRRASRLHPQSRDCRQALAWLYLQQKLPFESIRVLRELAALEPENIVYPAEITRLYVELGRTDDAERALLDFAESAPENPQAHAALGEFYLQVKTQPEAAREHANKAAELSGAARHWVLLSAAHELAGDVQGAIAALEKAAELEPEKLQYRQLLALLRERAVGAGGAPATPPDEAPLPQPASGALPNKKD